MIEFVLGVIVLFIFFVGAVKAFVWVNKTMVQRQENYEALRTISGSNLLMRENQWDYFVDDKDTADYNLGLVKDAVVNKFYNRNSGVLNWMVGAGWVPTSTVFHNYEPLDIFNEN